jgi:hypothetical protein
LSELQLSFGVLQRAKYILKCETRAVFENEMPRRKSGPNRDDITR